MENQLVIPNFSIALPDIHSWIKLIDAAKGTVLQNGAVVPGRVLVKYLIANEGATATGPFTVAWSLHKGGVIVPNATGSQQLTLAPMTVKVLTQYIAPSEIGTHVYNASMRADWHPNKVKEEDETNNFAQVTFTIHK